MGVTEEDAGEDSYKVPTPDTRKMVTEDLYSLGDVVTKSGLVSSLGYLWLG